MSAHLLQQWYVYFWWYMISWCILLVKYWYVECVILVCTADGVRRSFLQSVGEHTLALAVVRDAHNMYDVM